MARKKCPGRRAVGVGLPQIQAANACPFLLPQNFTRLRWQAAPAWTAVCVCAEFVCLSGRHRKALTQSWLVYLKVLSLISTGRHVSLFLWADEWFCKCVNPSKSELLCGFSLNTHHQNNTLLGPINYSFCLNTINKWFFYFWIMDGWYLYLSRSANKDMRKLCWSCPRC